MIDYEDIDTPTWLRERSHLPLFVIHLKLWQRWRDPKLWEQQMMGTWEVHDESHILSPSQFRKLHERASDRDLAMRYACENIKDNRTCEIRVTRLGMAIIGWDQAKMAVKQ